MKDHIRLGQKLRLTAKQAKQAERAFQRDLKAALEAGRVELMTDKDGRTFIYMKKEEEPSS